jgi:5-formyltetrahydrofolate cyclo-ligase
VDKPDNKQFHAGQLHTKKIIMRIVEKQKLRKQMRELIAQMSVADILTASRKIANALEAHPAWRQFHRVLSFVPLPEEPQLLDWALGSGKVVCVPAITPAGLDFCEIPGRSQLVARPLPGKSGRLLWEPGADCPRIEPCREDLILVPGLAFGCSGERLGRGGGFYDRFLQTFPGVKWGVCFPCQILDQIPTEQHDEKVDVCFC